MQQDTLTYEAPAGQLSALRRRAPAKQAPSAAFWRMLRLVRPHRRAMTWGIVLGFGVALTYAASLGGLLPVLKVVVGEESVHDWLIRQSQRSDRWYNSWLGSLAAFFPQKNTPAARMQSLLILLGGLFGVNLVGNALRCVSQYLVLFASHRAMMDLRRHMYRKALHVPLLSLSGDVSNRVSQFMSDTREIFLGITTLFGKVAREPLKAICVLMVALAIDWRLTLVVLAIAPIAIGLLWYFGRKVRKATLRMLQGYGVILGGLEESLQGIDVVKTHSREGHERRRMWQLERGMLKHQLKLSWIEAFSSPLIETVGVLVAAAGIVWLASRTFAGELDSSAFLTMVILLTAMLDPVRKVANVYNMVQRSGAAAERVFAFLDEPEERVVRRPQRLSPGAARAVTFDRVSFRYRPDGPLAVADVSLQVEPDERLALVGPNGSGKSTLLRLLPRLIEPTNGRVKIDGIDVGDLSLRALRREIAIVSQRPVIFARSVWENLAYGNKSATREQIQQAAQRSFADEFIRGLPQGYDTILGEFGTSLSGGQRQRIALARAFLSPCTILIFDEATSEIDADSERKIHQALEDLCRGKTTFFIAHRHTVMDLADRVAVMEAGRLIDVGEHAAVLARCPLYAGLYRTPTS